MGGAAEDHSERTHGAAAYRLALVPNEMVGNTHGMPYGSFDHEKLCRFIAF
jgi:hypothetical protein